MVILDREVGKIVIFDETGREVISSQEQSIMIPTLKLKMPEKAWEKQDSELLLLHSSYSF